VAEAIHPYAPPEAAVEDKKNALPGLASRRERLAAVLPFDA
jgi:hypothetical protein